MSPLRLNGSTSGYSEIDAPAVAGDQTFTLPGTGGTLDRLNRAGNILQVVQATYSTITNINSTSYVDSGLSGSITPSSSSSKVLVIASICVYSYRQSSSAYTSYLNIVRNSTQVTQQEYPVGSAASTDTYQYNPLSTALVYLDSPATTSSTTYKVQGKNNATSNDLDIEFHAGNTTSTLLLLEVAA